MKTDSCSEIYSVFFLPLTFIKWYGRFVSRKCKFGLISLVFVSRNGFEKPITQTPIMTSYFHNITFLRKGEQVKIDLQSVDRTQHYKQIVAG